MNAKLIVDRLTEAVDQSNLCVVLRSGEAGMEALLVADEKGRWSIPGGHAKGSESHAEAAKREVKEETGLDVEPEPLIWARHAARGPGREVNLFYAITDQAEARPGGGDVTKVRWAPVNELGDLNGTDRLAIHLGANRVHKPQQIVDDAVEVAESLGFAVATVAAPPEPVPGIYFRINGKAAHSYARRLENWAESLGWPSTVVDTSPFQSTVDALQRASKGRRLTPLVDGILHVSDALWRYESVVAPRLKEGHIVIEIGPEIDKRRLLERGLPPDLWAEMDARIPRPVALFDVGEDFTLSEFQVLKDSIEGMKDEAADAERFWALYNAPASAETWAEMDAIKAKYGGKPPMRPKKPKKVVTAVTGKKWVKGWVTGDALVRELVDTFDMPEAEAVRMVTATHAVDIAIDNFKLNMVDELKQARADDALEEFWQQEAIGELAQDVFSQWQGKPGDWPRRS